MKVLNIDGNFKPYCNSVEINHEFIQFSGGEMHIKIKDHEFHSDESFVITSRIRGGDDLMKICIAKDALNRLGAKDIELLIPYLPYARQDRQCDYGESFTLKVFANIINSLYFSKVTMLDCHSDVGSALIENSVNINNHSFVKKAYEDIMSNQCLSVSLVSPDSGSNKKCNKLFDDLKVFDTLIKCDKRRDVTNGELNGVEIFANDINGKVCLISDDICDGGRTFINLARELKKQGAGDLYLFVTHGIFSYGYEILNQYFKKIYTTNSFQNIDNELVKQFKIEL